MQLGYEQNTEELFMLYDAWETLNMKQLEYVDLLNQALKLQVTIERIIEKIKTPLYAKKKLFENIRP